MHDPEAILEELLAHDAWVRALARHLISDQHEADDVAQDAWVAALSKPPNRPGSIRSWLSRTARNIVRERRRADESRRRREQSVAKLEGCPPVEVHREQEEARHRVAVAVFSLEEPYRTAVVHRYFDGLAPREIASRLGVSTVAIEGRLRRGLQKLRARLDRDFGDRKTWCAALLPLTGLAAGEVTATTASILTGALVMSTKLKVAVGIAVLIATVAVLWHAHGNRAELVPKDATVPREEPGRRQPSSSALVAQANPESAERTQPTSETESTSLTERDATMQADRCITGTVKDASGVPIPAATVRAFQVLPFRTIEMRPLLMRHVDAHGKFVLCPVTLSQVVVEASAEGFHSERMAARPRAHLDFVLGPPSTLTGRVLLARELAPVVARVAAYRSKPVYDHNHGAAFVDELRAWAPDAVAQTDESGAYGFRALKPGRYLVKVLPEDYPALETWSASHNGISVNVAPGCGTVRDFVIEPGTRAYGRVLDRETGRPIAGARVGVRGYERCVFTDQDGHYEMRFGQSALVHVTAVGYLEHDRQYSFRCPEINLDIKLAPGTVVKGRVIGPDGAAIAGARVAPLKSRIPAEAEELDAVLTDDQGRFVLEDLRRGRIYARKPEFAWGVSRILTPVPGETMENVVIRLGRGSSIVGTVRFAIGRVAAGAEVNLQEWLPQGRWWTRRTVLTDGEGFFRMEHVPAGRWCVQALPPDSVEVGPALAPAPTEEVVIVPEASRSEVNLLLRPGLSICGRIVDDLDRPVEGATVCAIPWQTKAGSQALIYLGHPIQTVHSDATGAFRVVGLVDGSRVYQVEASQDGYRVGRADGRGRCVPAGVTDLLFRATRLTELRGTVVDGVTGESITQFRISADLLATETQRRFSVTEDFNSSDGQFLLPVEVGEHRVTATTPDGRESEPRSVQVLQFGNTEPTILRVVEQAGLTGLVRTPLGQPAAGGEVRAVARGRGYSLAVRAPVDARGRFRFPSLSRGTYDLLAAHPHHPEWFARAQIELEPGVRGQVFLDFVEGGRVQILVTDESGRPVHNASVVIVNERRDRIEPDANRYGKEFAEAVRIRKLGPSEFFSEFSRTNQEGRIRPWKLSPDRYSVRVRAPGFKPVSMATVVTGGQETGVRIQLKPSR